jgi:glucose/arabinose dehydrogenase
MIRMLVRDRGAWLRGVSMMLVLSGAALVSACSGDDDGADGADDGGDDSTDDGDDGGDDDGGDGVACDADNGSITLPDGFCASVFADGVGAARHMAVTPSGDVFVAVQDSFDGTTIGGVTALRDVDADGIADETETFADEGGNGIAWSDGQLFFAQNDRVLRYDVADGELLPAGEPEVVVGELPADNDHGNKTVVLNEAGEILVNIGSGSNSCQVENRVVESEGIDPCPELDIRAGVWAFAADGTDQIQEEGVNVGEGLRNMVALAVQPGTDALFGVQNGRDQLYDNWPAIYEPEDELLLPSEEVFLIEGDTEYGWPYCYHDPFLDQKVLAPEYGGDGVEVDLCADVVQPDYVFPAHWAPLGMLFYTGDMFPEQYLAGAFVAFHGSRFEPDATGDLPGYNVVFLPFDGDLPADGDFEEFATEFAGDARPLPDEAEYRPVGLAQGPDGELYISDDHGGGRIWRVIYTGE